MKSIKLYEIHKLKQNQDEECLGNMSYLSELWPEQGRGFFDVNGKKYLTKVTWSKNFRDDYQKMSNDFFMCGYRICKNIINNASDHIMTDMWFLPCMYLFRQSLELGLKALVCNVKVKKHEIQQEFCDSKHDLSKLYDACKDAVNPLLIPCEIEWIKNYLESLETIDAKSDLFRFPFEDVFLQQFKYEQLDIVNMANGILQAYGIIQKCLQIPEENRVDRFDPARKSDFLLFSNDSACFCSLWEAISGDGFHKQIWGYSEAARFLLFECIEIKNDDKAFVVIFLLRNLVELGLKRLFYKKIEHGVSEKDFANKRKSHLLFKELWRSVRPTIEHYSDENGYDLAIIDLVESQIKELSGIDKKGDTFRYPTTYGLEYRLENIYLDLKNVYEFMQGLFNFFEGCDSFFLEVKDWESEMAQNYNDWY